eukprot:GHRQ01033216.1.p1 GENE.GHRQ01033216.1~~GHRQ01033216.1.p1  ORF type:complete len:132 (+),score=4.38 GHRQ01033216.1:362-757(+)
MKGHLRLHFSSAEGSDEAVLSVYPTTIRRRILRHLYSSPLDGCWLFYNCKQKFLDAVLASAKVELYMPKVRITWSPHADRPFQVARTCLPHDCIRNHFMLIPTEQLSYYMCLSATLAAFSCRWTSSVKATT